MNLPMKWLKEFVPSLNTDPKHYSDVMTDTGSKVEGYETLSEEVQNVKVGLIKKIERHPDADRLVVCQVDIGTGTDTQIITAATNVFEGALVPVAVAPAHVMGGEIKKTKMRGIESNGMFCSIAELGLTLNDMPYAIEDGILILKEDCTPGDDVKELLQIEDTVVEFEITSNRPDCLSVIGLARETAASFNIPAVYHTPTVKGSGDNVENYISVEVKDTEKCPRYSARYVKNVKIEPSPLWLRMRLRAAGVRPINNIVDITNYVMLEYGQPMHAFDYACLDGSKIVVRTAAEGEVFKSLDDKDHTLTSDMLVIADEKKAVALAGVMGGANSEIKDTTTAVVFESANFLGSSVRTTARDCGMRTESSARFEKGLDPEMTLEALNRACELVEMLGAGEVVDGIIDVYGKKWEQVVLPLECDRINKFLGVNLDEKYMTEILERLGFKVENGMIYSPSFRIDIGCMNDIAEEIIRIHGYNSIESTLFASDVKVGLPTESQGYRRRICNFLCSLGFDEIYTFSFISPKYYDKIALPANSKQRNSVVISNPLGEDTSVMRTTAIPSIMEVLAHNNNHHSEAVSLYEMAKVYIPSDDITQLPEEKFKVMAGFYGNGDFYRMKGVVGAILENGGIIDCDYRAKSDDPTFHPGRCAEIVTADGKVIGIFGEIHPDVASNYGIDCPVYVAELDFNELLENSNFERKYKHLPKFPASTRDFAFVCAEEVEVGAIEKVMKKAGGKLVENVKLFDVYRGAQVPEGMKSLAFKVTMRSADHTLTDEEADKATKKILTLLERELGITLRA
ncbi:MAG: phenylalanine--tRNA ligase subunit beta [Ruminococcaceae bacterium]|nr:phenylalanine--tRNA ligase subunit beta [Oscillospiraceae bacterium]